MAAAALRFAALCLLVATSAHAQQGDSPLSSTNPPLAEISADDVRDYHKSGRLLSRGVLDRGAVQNISARMKKLLTTYGRRAFGGDAGQKEVRFTFAVHELDAGVASFINKRTGSLWHAATRLAGTTQLCVLMDRGFSKDPGDPDTHWHRDDEAIGLHHEYPALRTLHAWIPLGDVEPDMGTLQYRVGTHRQDYSLLQRFLASAWGWEFAQWATCPTVQDEAMQLGDVAWHDGWTLHSAGSNTLGAVRDAYAVSFVYCPRGSPCKKAAMPVSGKDATCKIAERMFDRSWRKRHRDGEQDYAKTLITEPLPVRAARFVWRSVVGAAGGLGVHWLATAGCSKRKAE